MIPAHVRATICAVPSSAASAVAPVPAAAAAWLTEAWIVVDCVTDARGRAVRGARRISSRRSRG